MKPTLFRYGVLVLTAGLVLSSCKDREVGLSDKTSKKDTNSVPWTELTPATPIYDDPADVALCNPTDLQLIRDLAQSNGFAEDYASDNPSEWKYDHLGIIWRKTKDETTGKDQYYIAELGGKRGGGETITRFVFNDQTEQFSALERIELHLPKAKFISIGMQPKLRTIILSGKTKEGEEVAPLVKLTTQDLPELDSLFVSDFPKLKKSNTDDIFHFSSYYEYDKLRHVSLKNTGVEALNISTREPLKTVVFEANSQLKQLHIEEAVVPNLTFEPADYPLLENLKLNKLQEGSGSKLVVKNLTKLNTLIVNKVKGLESVQVANCPQITDLTLTDLNLPESKFTIDHLPEVRNWDYSGNALTSFDLSNQTSIRSLNVSHNLLTSSDNFRLPPNVRGLSIVGNEQLSKLDLSPYALIESLNVNGYKKGADRVGGAPNALQELNLSQLPKLYRVLASNNQLGRILVGNADNYEDMEGMEIDRNMLHPDVLEAIHQAIPSLPLGSRGDFNYSDQRPFEIVLPNGSKTVTFEMGKAHPEVRVRVKDVPASDYSYDTATGRLTFAKAGSYVVVVDCSAVYSLLPSGLTSTPLTVK